MEVRTTTLTLLSSTEFLMDRDNISFGEKLTRWQKDPLYADVQAPGDDRAPAWGWLGKLHYDEPTGYVGIPVGMLQACLRGAAATVPHPTAKGNKTLKELSQAGIQFMDTSCALLVKTPHSGVWGPISYPELYYKLAEETDFLVHEEVVKQFGFVLDVRRARPQWNRSHIRVRPKFSPWRCVCTLQLHDEVLTDAVLSQLFTIAGTQKGIGNWRPSNSKAGSYGLFSVIAGIPKDVQEAWEGLAQARPQLG